MFSTKRFKVAHDLRPRHEIMFDPLSVEQLLAIYTTKGMHPDVLAAVEGALIKRVERRPMVMYDGMEVE